MPLFFFFGSSFCLHWSVRITAKQKKGRGNKNGQRTGGFFKKKIFCCAPRSRDIMTRKISGSCSPSRLTRMGPQQLLFFRMVKKRTEVEGPLASSLPSVIAVASLRGKTANVTSANSRRSRQGFAEFVSDAYLEKEEREKEKANAKREREG